jgi:hypothetical protein
VKKLDLSRVSLPALSIALSLALSFTVVDVIAAQGMKAVAALENSQPFAYPLQAQAHLERVANAARTRG